MYFYIKKLLTIIVFVYIALIGIGITYSDQLIFLAQAPAYTLSDQHIIIKSRNSSNNKTSNQIVALYLENPDSNYTILYSHGNAVDIGGLHYLQKRFYNHGYSIIIYDYSGYGHSEGTATEQQVYNDVQAIYDYLINNKKIKPEQIISYGHSLGAAIATDLAYNNKVAGLVLESPFTSAFRVKTVYSIMPFDKFSSVDKIKNIYSPLLITHTRDDRVIPFWHGEELFDIANPPKKFLTLETGGHAGITHTEKFWLALATFTGKLLSPD